MNKELMMLCANSAVMLFITFFYYKVCKRRNGMHIGTFLLGIYSLQAVMSIVFYLQPYSIYMLNGKMTWWPFVYWLAVFLIFMIPIFQFDRHNITAIKYDYGFLRKLAYFGLAISIIPFFEQLLMIPSLIMHAGGGDVAEAMGALHDDGNIDDKLSVISRNLLRLNIAIYDISFLMLIIFFIHPHKERMAIAGVVITLITRNLTGIVAGHRSALVQVILVMILVILIGYRQMSNIRKQQLRKYSFILISGFGGMFLLITIGRQLTHASKNEEFTLVYFLSRYIGEGPVLFNEYVWNQKCLTYGDFTFWYLKDIMGLEPHTMSYDYLYVSLQPKSGVPENCFYTFIGSFVRDFGLTITFIYLSAVSFLFSLILKFKGNTIRLSTLYAFMFYATIIVTGTSSYQYCVTHGKFVIWHILIFFILRHKNM